MCRRSVWVICSVLLAFGMQAQQGLSKKITDNGNKKRKFGRYTSFGVTSSMTDNESSPTSYAFSSTTVYDLNYRAFSKPAPFVRFGAFVTPERGLLNMIHFGMGYKQLRGGQTLYGSRGLNSDISFPEIVENETNFRHHIAEISLDLQNILPLSKTQFIIHGPGVSFDMLVKQKSETEGSTLIPLPKGSESNGLISNVNYSLAYGLKLSQGKFLMVELRTPIMTILNEDNRSGYRSILNSRYKPMMLAVVKYSWLSNKVDLNCVNLSGSGKRGRFSSKRSSKFHPW